MNCYQSLLMKYFLTFLSTFLIYFGVFGLLDYKTIVGKIMNFLMKIPEKILTFLGKFIPNFIKNFFKRFFSSIYKYFTEGIPAYYNKKRTEVKKPLEQRLEELKKKENDSLKNKNAKTIFSFVEWFNTLFSNVKLKTQTFWEKFKDVALAGIILSLFYYVIWYLIMVVLVNIIKYLLNTATGGQQILEEMQEMMKQRSGGSSGSSGSDA